MSQPVEVRQVQNPADFKAFFEFPWTLYKDDPNWVPLLLSMRKEHLDKQKNPSWEYMDGEYFTAWRGDQLVGTITGHVNHRHNEFHNENVGWFGMFEVYDDAEAAAALLEAASSYVKGKGCTAIRGPQSFTTHDECGLLVNNFEPPILLMSYNPPYYAGLVEGAGFTKVMDAHSLYYDRQMLHDNQGQDRIIRLAERVKKRSKVTLRPISRKNLKADFELFKELYNAAWSENWGFVPMTPKELDNMVVGLGQFFEPSLACFAEVDSDPAGFMLTIPDFNRVLKKAYPRPGTPEVISLLKAAWHWKVRPVMDRIRVPLMGVKAEYRDKGVELVMFQYIMETILDVDRYKSLDCSWILESNHDMIGVLEGLGAKIYKTHRFYEKQF